MKVENKNLFPLYKILPSIKSMYFMDANGAVYSNSTGRLTRLSGSSSASRTFTFQLANARTSYRTTSSHRRDELVAMARKHPDFKRETADEISLDSLGVDMTKLKPVSMTGGRTHATSTEEGIKARGSIIGRLHKGHLVFGSAPKIHTSAESVEAEMTRLALEHPGVTFVECKIARSIVAGCVKWG